MTKSESLQNLRHSASHLLAAAVKELWPDVKLAIGPVIRDGFYYDFDFPQPISENDLVKIEQKMREMVADWKQFEGREIKSSDAQKEFKGNPYKLELIDEFTKKGEALSVFTSGNFTDLCKGGHCDNPSKQLRYFKLLSLAGAYWRGSEKNPMLTRIYGTAFETKKELDEYLHRIEDAKKRDHRKIGKELDLFTFSPLVGPGLPLWTPRGTLMRELIDNYVWELRKARGYEKVAIPHLTKKELYETSGHWQKYASELLKITTREGRVLVVKPMNCPHHVQIYNRFKHSYKELPVRYAETTTIYRDEQSGELNGLSRVMSITQDDAHVFCRYSQIKQEASSIWDIIQQFYATFDLKPAVRLSLHDPDHFDTYLGTPAAWKNAETELRAVVKERDADAIEALGEAAFYGPKIDFMAHDALGREWQVATIQLDMNQPERFNLSCVNEKGQNERIVMIHAAIAGSLERFLSMIIEHFAGNFPVWLAPEQVRLASVADRHVAYCKKLSKELMAAFIRVASDVTNETIGNKIRKAALDRIPYTVVVGDKEAASAILPVRIRGQNKIMNVKAGIFIKALQQKMSTRDAQLDL